MGNMANPERDLVYSPYWFPVAHVTDQSAAVTNCLWLLSALEEKWFMGTFQYISGQASAR
jgi:hypothetical protein